MSPSSTRDAYHHGDLRNALVRAAAELAATGGPHAVTIRGAAREVVVTPTAAYRHFANQADLLLAAKQEAMAGMFAAMAAHIAEVPEDGDAATVAIRRLTSTGRAYVRYALTEPGIFLTCFSGNLQADAEDAAAGTEPDLAAKAPYALLGEMLDGLVATGYLDPADRGAAEYGPWAAVHGVALLLLDGPLRGAPEHEKETALEVTLRMVERALATGPNGPRAAGAASTPRVNG